MLGLRMEELPDELDQFLSLNPGVIEFLQSYRGMSVTQLNECKRNLCGENNDLVVKHRDYKK